MAASFTPAGAYDEEFIQHMGLARTLISKLRRMEDRDIATKWVIKLCNMNSASMVVKKNRNKFFRYLLTIVHLATQGHQEHYGYPQYSSQHGLIGTHDIGKTYVSRWSPDNRTYVAIKPMPGRGALVYMAVATIPELGWEIHE